MITILVVGLSAIGFANNKANRSHDPHGPGTASSPRSPSGPHSGSSRSHKPGHHDCDVRVDRVERELAEARARIIALEAELKHCRHK